VLSARHRDRVSAMPVVSYASISDKPPLLGVACNPYAFTFRLALKARCFSLSLLDTSELSCIERLATISGAKVEDKLAEAGLRHTPGTKVDVPVIAGSAATIECSLLSKRKMGDHILLVGRAEACYASEDFSDFWGFARYRPILYTGWKDGMTTYPRPSVRRR